ncbi:MAG: VWA domain-containing protein, partial [Myxococcales bacterium]|nr:VWA domain-containing protein [Myxococcales bacterium]
MKKPVSFTLVLSLAASFACGSSERDAIFDPNQNPAVPPGTSPDGGPAGPVFGGENTNGLQLDPVNAVVFIDTSTNPPTPATQAFKVIRKDPAGDRDVTAGATFTLERPELGAFNGATFTSVATLPAGPLGQTTGVTVKADGGSTGGKLTIVALRRGSENRDFFFVEPFNEAPTPQNDVLKFKTNIQSVDVAFVTDTTGSMSDEITGIRNALAGNLLTQLQAAIPNVGIAIVSHKDETDGTGNLVRVLSPVTTTLSQAQTAAGQLGASGG